MENKIFAAIRLRLLAAYLDFAILALPITFLLWYAGASLSMPILVQRSFLLLIIWLLFTILSLLHPIFFTHYFGGTIGKLLTGLKVIGEHGKYLSLKRSFFRHTVGYQFSGILFGLGFLAIIKDAQKQGWHDKAVGSKVIVERKNWPLALLILLALIILNLYILYSAFNTAFSGPLPKEFKSFIDSFQAEQEKTQPSTPALSEVEEWKTYRNDEFGFEVKYPAWWVEDVGAINFVNPESGSAFQVAKNSNPDNLSIDEWFKQATQINGRSTVKAAAERIMINGVPAYKLEAELAPPNPLFEVVAIANNQGDIFSIYAYYKVQEDAETLNEILTTFRFVE